MPDVAQSIIGSYELSGRSDAPVVVVLGGISASRRVADWWPRVVGERRVVDTTRLAVLGLDYLDGGVRADGRPERTVSTHDQAGLLASVLDELEIERIHTLIGASYRARVTPTMVAVGLVEVAESDPLGALQGTDNQFAFVTERYREHPLVIRRPLARDRERAANRVRSTGEPAKAAGARVW